VRRFVITYHNGNDIKVEDYRSDTELNFVAGEIFYLCTQHLGTLEGHTRDWEINSIVEVPEGIEFNQEAYLQHLDETGDAILLLHQQA